MYDLGDDIFSANSNFRIWKCCILKHIMILLPLMTIVMTTINMSMTMRMTLLILMAVLLLNEEHVNDYKNTMMTMRVTLLILMASSLLVRSQVSKSREAVEESICIVHWKQYWYEYWIWITAHNINVKVHIFKLYFGIYTKI